MKWILMPLFAFLFSSAALGQSTSKEHVVQISGIVLAGDSLYPAPYVGIVRMRDQRGTYTDRSGYFTLPVLAGDTLEFFSLGLKASSFVIPAETKETSLSLVQVMDMDTIMLPTAYVLPYPAPYKLRQEVLSLDLPGDEYQSFSRDMASITQYDGMADFKDAAYRNASSTLTARYTNSFQSGGNLLNASAWNKLMKSLKDDK